MYLCGYVCIFYLMSLTLPYLNSKMISFSTLRVDFDRKLDEVSTLRDKIKRSIMEKPN